MSASPLTDLERGEAAQKAIKRNMVQLIKGVTVGDVPVTLYAEEFLRDETWEQLILEVPDTKKANLIVRDIQKRVCVCPDMLETFCQILSREKPTEDLAKAIHVTYEKELEAKISSHKSSLRGPLRTLMSELATFKSLTQRTDTSPSSGSVDDCIKGSIKHYIETSFEDDTSICTLRSELSNLHNNEVLISREMYDWATKELSQRSTKQVSAVNASAITESTPKEPPHLYGPSTLYHAALCCSAVSSSRNETEAHRFFSEKRHKLNQVSVCEENPSEGLDLYLIARNGDVIYVAFQSEAKLSKWLTKYSTFEEGIEKQTEKVPVWFLHEQMLKQQKIVLTGFSFGGLLACSIALNFARQHWIGVFSSETCVALPLANHL